MVVGHGELMSMACMGMGTHAYGGYARACAYDCRVARVYEVGFIWDIYYIRGCNGLGWLGYKLVVSTCKVLRQGAWYIVDIPNY